MRNIGLLIHSTAMTRVSLLAAVFCAALPVYANTIVIAQGTNPSDFDQNLSGPNFREYAEVGWQTGPTAYSNVTITALLTALDPGGDLFDAYLSNSIGPGATSLLTATGLSVSTFATFSTITLFSGINLAANTNYYLTLAPETNQGINWAIDAVLDKSFNVIQSPLVLDSGVSFLSPPGFCSDDGGNCSDPPPTSGFGDLGAIPVFTVTAVSSGVPETSTLWLLATGLAAAAVLRRKTSR